MISVAGTTPDRRPTGDRTTTPTGRPRGGCKVKILYTSKAEAEEAGREAEAASLLPALPSMLPISCNREYGQGLQFEHMFASAQSRVALYAPQIFLDRTRRVRYNTEAVSFYLPTDMLAVDARGELVV